MDKTGRSIYIFGVSACIVAALCLLSRPLLYLLDVARDVVYHGDIVDRGILFGVGGAVIMTIGTLIQVQGEKRRKAHRRLRAR